ncbi:tRNA pseudouridine(55) synthase TruB [Candidatus Poriferisodalis sp.]|uniref:tRNA pseudouridine(55) synthase TruB n=1 Tax=Candidatus Poriferisodalis sp. TaxID=3101277 RepID=UPI003B0242E2
MARRRPATVHGSVIVDKPHGPTSHDVVALLRRRFGERRIGHAGTLDPSATGVLVVGIGSATRLLRFATAGRKSYECEIVFGAETSTLDAAGETVATWRMDLDPTEVADAAAGFVGSIFQLPPMVSAVRVGGRRLHEIARSGEAAERVPREVEVYRFEVESTGDPRVYRASVDCSAGTYVRTLGADLGSALGGGAHIRALRRTRSGGFSLAEAESPERAALRPPGELVRDLRQIRLSDDDAADARQGVHLAAHRYDGPGPWTLIDPDGRLVAVHERVDDRLRATVLPPQSVRGPAAE